MVAVARDVTPLATSRSGTATGCWPSADVRPRERSSTWSPRRCDRLGRLDVVVNNAGVLSMGMVEEFSEAEARALMDVNFFGALWVGQAVLPHLRERRAGTSCRSPASRALGGFPMTGIYSASKFALEGLSEALAAEAAHFGVTVSILQPGGYWTDLYTRHAAATPLAAYVRPARGDRAAVVRGVRSTATRSWPPTPS